jgi:hypothetical protein
MRITQNNGRTDNRYTVTLEHTGQPTAVYVARFCGDWLGSNARDAMAWLICAEHKALRVGGAQ